MSLSSKSTAVRLESSDWLSARARGYRPKATGRSAVMRAAACSSRRAAERKIIVSLFFINYSSSSKRFTSRGRRASQRSDRKHQPRFSAFSPPSTLRCAPVQEACRARPEALHLLRPQNRATAAGFVLRSLPRPRRRVDINGKPSGSRPGGVHWMITGASHNGARNTAHLVFVFAENIFSGVRNHQIVFSDHNPEHWMKPRPNLGFAI